MKTLYSILKESEQTNLPEIYLDMDGTIVDWEKGANKELVSAGYPEWNDPYWKKTYGNKADDVARWNIINKNPKFWEQLEFFDDGLKIWNFVKKYRPSILSACGALTKNCEKGKMNWIRMNLEPSRYINKIHLVNRADKKKYAVDKAGNKTILIDDYIKNCVEYENAGGIAIQVTTASQVIQKLKKLGF